MAEENWTAKYINEIIGTFILILIGNGAVVASILTGAYGLFGVAFLWGFAVMFAVYWAGGVSSAHINPAVTIANAAFRGFPWRRVPGYIGAQLLGAFLAAATLWVTWSGWYAAFHEAQGFQPGEPGSSLSAMTLWTFAPNPAFAGVTADQPLTSFANLVSFPQWFFSEVVITAILVGVIFALVDDRNPMGTRESPALAAFLIGLLVAALVQYEAPVSMAALNPARDIGPRIFGFLVGYGNVAFPGPRAGFWVPTVSTIAGGLLGGALYDFLTRSTLIDMETETMEQDPRDPVAADD